MLCLEIKKEARTGFEPVHQGVADPRLTAWLQSHQIAKLLYQKIIYKSNKKIYKKQLLKNGDCSCTLDCVHEH